MAIRAARSTSPPPILVGRLDLPASPRSQRRRLAAPALVIGPRFNVISGSATAIDPQRFRDECGGATDFHATVIPDRIVVNCMLHYLGLGDYEAPNDNIAVLQESNTSFGRSARELRTERQAGECASPAFRPFALCFLPLSVAHL